MVKRRLGKMKIAIIGCGKQAQKHLKGFIENQVVDFLLYDPLIERAKELATKFDCQVTDNIDSIFLDKTVTAVDICTPVQFHKELAIKSITAGKHFFCEKPLTTSLADDELIRDLSNKYAVIGMVGYIYRFSPILREVKEIIRKNVLGEIHSALFRIGGRGNHAIWKHFRISNGGVLNEMAVHMIDLILWYFGNISEVRLLDAEICLPTRIIENQAILSDTEDFVLAKLRTDEGLPILLMADFLSSDFNQSIELQGSNGSLKASIQGGYPHEVRLIEGVGGYPQGKTTLNYQNDDLYKAQMHHFLDLIKSSHPRDNRHSLDNSCKVMRIHNYLRDEILKIMTSQAQAPPHLKENSNEFIRAAESPSVFY